VIKLHPSAAPAFRRAVRAASVRPDVRQAIANVYHALDEQIELRRPVCRTSGRCCRFDEFGHRLFVTTMEVASFIHGLPAGSAPGGLADARSPACPFQQHHLCMVHTIRPFGCRVFFCDETSTDWQRQQYESFHAELRRLHERLEVEYFYIEWRAALAALFAEDPALPMPEPR
jgi:Fe-S-cluster containining protein